MSKKRNKRSYEEDSNVKSCETELSDEEPKPYKRNMNKHYNMKDFNYVSYLTKDTDLNCLYLTKVNGVICIRAEEIFTCFCTRPLDKENLDQRIYVHLPKIICNGVGVPSGRMDIHMETNERHVFSSSYSLSKDPKEREEKILTPDIGSPLVKCIDPSAHKVVEMRMYIGEQRIKFHALDIDWDHNDKSKMQKYAKYREDRKKHLFKLGDILKAPLNNGFHHEFLKKKECNTISRAAQIVHRNTDPDRHICCCGSYADPPVCGDCFGKEIDKKVKERVKEELEKHNNNNYIN